MNINEIFKEVLGKIKTTETLKSVTDKGLEKLAASAIGATLWDMGTIFLLLMFLIIIDTFTACVYQASLLYKAMYDKKIVDKKGSLITYIKYIWSAHHWRFVDSGVLRDGFFSKIICYGLLICTGRVIDAVLDASNAHIANAHIAIALPVFCLVMACTEGISICENLDSSGVKIGGELRDILKKKKEKEGTK